MTKEYDLWQKPGMKTSDDPRRVPVKEDASADRKVWAITGVRLIDGTGMPQVADAAVVIRGNQIMAAGPRSEVTIPSGSEVVECPGTTLLPGLIDLHIHLAYPETPIEAYSDTEAFATVRAVSKLGAYLRSGITSVRDMASRGDVAFAIKEGIKRGYLTGPRVFPTGKFITATGGHGTERTAFGTALVYHGEVREANGPYDFRAAVREQIKAGADYIKTGSNFTREEIAAAVDEAHQLGIRVTSDAHTHYIRWAVEAGIDCIEHPLPRTQETIDLMKAKGTYAVPTLVPYIRIFDTSGGFYNSLSRRFHFSREDNLEMLRRLKAAGITMGIGTDLVYNWYRELPDPYLVELKEFLKAGFSMIEVIKIASRNGAEILGMLDKLGTVEPGKLADLIVVEGDVLSDVEVLRRLRYVIIDGKIVLKKSENEKERMKRDAD